MTFAQIELNLKIRSKMNVRCNLIPVSCSLYTAKCFRLSTHILVYFCPIKFIPENIGFLCNGSIKEQLTSLVWIQPVWLDVRLKSSPISTKSYPKTVTAVCFLKVLFSKWPKTPHLKENLSPRMFENSTIWSHWIQPIN